MPQNSTNVLNKTVTDFAFVPGLPFTDSLSVRLTNMQQGTYVELYGIAWGMFPTVTTLSFVTGNLLILKNEIFDPATGYVNAAITTSKDVVFRDQINARTPFKYIDFDEPMRLDDAANYLIVCGAFDQNGVIPPATVSAGLTVRGSLIQSQKSYIDLKTR
ncbi:MAG TPA: hypothetical protein VH815_03125 [Acidobacteriota bacterium]|jgi:hypothetical protein